MRNLTESDAHVQLQSLKTKSLKDFFSLSLFNYFPRAFKQRRSRKNLSMNSLFMAWFRFFGLLKNSSIFTVHNDALRRESSSCTKIIKTRRQLPKKTQQRISATFPGIFRRNSLKMLIFACSIAGDIIEIDSKWLRCFFSLSHVSRPNLSGSDLHRYRLQRCWSFTISWNASSRNEIIPIE